MIRQYTTHLKKVICSGLTGTSKVRDFQAVIVTVVTVFKCPFKMRSLYQSHYGPLFLYVSEV